jgi:hypothetical protein
MYMKEEKEEEKKESETVELAEQEYCHYSGLPSPEFYQQ